MCKITDNAKGGTQSFVQQKIRSWNEEKEMGSVILKHWEKPSEEPVTAYKHTNDPKTAPPWD